MQTKQRLGQVAQQVINAALYSDAVNRAGQLRMLSQRIVKLYAARAGLGSDGDAALADSTVRVDDNIAILRRSLSKATFGDLIDSVADPWSKLKTAIKSPVTLDRLLDVDARAEDLLGKAERLTANLETAGLATTLRVINVAGRQRMLAQRTAKLALLGALLQPAAAAAVHEQGDATMSAFREGLDYLKGVPLSTAAIREGLAGADALWSQYQAALSRMGTREGQAAVVALSESLTEGFEHLTALYERSMQVLLA